MWKEMLRRVTRGSGAPPTPFVGAYGKLPRIGDFVAVHAEKAPAFGFQEWLGRAVDWADRKQLTGWPGQFEAIPGAAFTYRPPPTKRAEGVLAGAIWASRDAVGRRYPFAIFSLVPDEIVRSAPHLLPVAMEGFVDQVLGLQGALGNATSVAEIDALLSSLRPIGIDESAGRAYEAWLGRTAARTTWESLYGRADGDGALYALQMVRETLAPFQGVEDARTEIGVRLPLGTAPAFEAAFWLDVVQRIGRAARATPTTLLVPRGAAGRGLFVALGGDPNPATLAEATVGTGDTDHVCDLTVAEPDRGSMARLPVLASHLEASIRSETATLGHVIDALA